jgi:hypothetical protein
MGVGMGGMRSVVCLAGVQHSVWLSTVSSGADHRRASLRCRPLFDASAAVVLLLCSGHGAYRSLLCL